MSAKMLLGSGALALGLVLASTCQAQVQEYGDEDVLGTGTYPSDPKAGATLKGLSAGTVTVATNSFAHNYPFDPSAGEFAGTDQIYVGSTQTAFHDGYSSYSGRKSGPQILMLDYSSLVPSGATIKTLTLGIAADDFQNPVFGQAYTASLNNSTASDLTTELNSLNETGPIVQFFTIGIDTSVLKSNHILTLSIDQTGDGGDGWAVDFLTVGVTTSASTAVPEPGSIALLGASLLTLAGYGWRRKHLRSTTAA